MAIDALAQLRSERDRFVAFSFAGADLLIQLDESGVVRYAAGAARRMTGRDAATLLGTPFGETVLSEDRTLLATFLRRLGRVGLRSDPIIIRLCGDGDGSVMAVLAGCKLPDVADGYHLTLTEANPSVATATLSGHRDTASGLLVAKDFEQRAIECLRVAKDLGRDLGLTFVELSNFDRFVDRAGPAQGDALLSDIGGALRAASIGGNSAGYLEQARFGVLHEAGLLADALVSDVGSVARRADPTGIVGVASRNLALPLSQMTAEDAANALAYAVTQFAGQGAAAFSIASAEDGLTALVAETLERVADFKLTVAEERFNLAYQPIVDLATRQVHHYEALTRFAENASPYETIRFAEGVHLTGEFDLAVCRRTLETLLGFGRAKDCPTIAVNISARSITSDLFVATLHALLAKYPERRRELMFEITESAQIQDLVRAGNVIQVLREAGHRVCLDDFGAGSASFPYLRALNVDFVKIDGAYVRQAVSDRRDRAILKSMTMLCQDLEIGTIAEMIETDEQGTLLLSLGVGYGQGWLFGRPGALPGAGPRFETVK